MRLLFIWPGILFEASLKMKPISAIYVINDILLEDKKILCMVVCKHCALIKTK